MKHLKLTFLLAVLMSMVGARASAHDFEVANADGKTIYYVKTSDTEVAVTYRGSSYNEYNDEYTGNVVIPESVTYDEKTYSVTSIGEYAFSGCSGLISVTIPNSVTDIGKNAFNGCSNLTIVTINSNSIVAVNRYVDYSLGSVFGNQVEKYILGDEVTSIGEYAFDGCFGLKSITIGNSLTNIGEYAFSCCEGLQKVIVPDLATWFGISFGDSPLNYAHHLYSDENTEITDLVIPNSVTSIDNYAFRNCSGFTSVTIPNSVTNIGYSAFEGCSGLTSVTIPNSVTNIGTAAFKNCSGLTSITIGNGVTNIGTAAFWYCSGLTSVEFHCATIGSWFNGLTSIEQIVIGDEVTSIGSSAFSGCSGLTSVTIPNSVTSIGTAAFSGCSGLTSVTIPNSVTDIGYNAFYGCSNLTTVTINSNNIVAVNRDWDNSLGSVFGNQVKNYILGDEVTSIGNSAFSNCSGLTSVTIGNSVTSIGECAFEDCSGLTSIFIPNSVTSIGFAAFSSCDALQKVIVPDLAAWCGISFENKSANPLYYAHHLYSDENTEITDLVIPNSVTSISGYAFSGCSGLTSVTIPNNVTNIGYSAFENCSGLTSVEFHCATIGSWFNGLTSIEQIIIGDEVTSIGNNSELIIAFEGCSGLTSITVESGNTVYDSRNDCNAIIETASNTLISGCKNTLIPDGVTSIGIGAFFGCTNLSSIIIPSSVTTIASNAFQDCTNLSSITIPNNITSVGYYAFGGTAWYDNLPDGMVYIGKVAYNYKGAMPANTNIILEEGTLSITAAAFRNCIGLTSITIPNSITNIGNYAFQGCSGLTSVTIPNSVTSIGVGTFLNCSGLTSLDIPSTVTSIGNSAFSGCTGLTEINCYIESPYGIDNGVFSSSTYNSALLRVPVGTKSIYKIANGWYNFQNIEEFVESTDVSLLTDAIYANDMKASKGNYGTLIINLKNEQATNAYSFDLKLPTGVTLAMEGGDYVYTLSGRHNGHSATISYQSATDVYSIAALSLQSKTLNGNDGTIITLKLNIATDIALDSYPIRIQNAKYSLVTGETKVSMPETTAVLTVSDFVMGDVNNDGDVDIADAVCIVNHVVGKDTPVFVVAAADVNHDGDVDIADAVCIVNLVVGKISALSREEEWNLPEPQ